MKKLDSYILKEMIPFFLVGFSFFNLVFIVNKLLDMMDLLIVKKVEAGTVLLLFIYMQPFIWAITIPISVLVSVLMAFGRISSDSELIAFLTAGTSYSRMIRVPLILGISVSLFMILFNDRILPWGNHKFKKLYSEIVMKKPFSQLQEHRFVTIDNRIFGIDKIDQKKGTLEGIIIYERDKTTQSMTVTTAERGRWLTNQKIRNSKNEVFQIMRLELEKGTVQSYENINRKEFHIRYFDKLVITISTKITEDISVERSVREMSIIEVIKKIKETKKQNRNYYMNDLLVEFHKKIAIPFASLAFIVLGVGLALIPKKSGVGYGLGMSIAIIFIYYLFLTVGENYAKTGRITPFIGVWYTNILLTLSGGVILLRISK